MFTMCRTYLLGLLLHLTLLTGLNAQTDSFFVANATPLSDMSAVQQNDALGDMVEEATREFWYGNPEKGLHDLTIARQQGNELYGADNPSGRFLEIVGRWRARALQLPPPNRDGLFATYRRYHEARSALERQRKVCFPDSDIVLTMNHICRETEMQMDRLFGSPNLFTFDALGTRSACLALTGDKERSNAIVQHEHAQQISLFGFVDDTTLHRYALTLPPGDPRQIEACRQALEFIQRYKFEDRVPGYESLAQLFLADALYAAGEREEADKLAAEAHARLPETSDLVRESWAIALRDRYYGRKALDQGRPVDADQLLASAINGFKDPCQHGGVCKGLVVAELLQLRGQALRATNRPYAAMQLEKEAQEILDHMAKLRAALAEADREMQEASTQASAPPQAAGGTSGRGVR